MNPSRRAILGAGGLLPAAMWSTKRGGRVPFRNLQPVQVTSAPDTSGANTGFLTAAFPSSLLPNVRVYEIYHMTVTGGTFLDTARIVANGRLFSTVQLDLSGQNEWDPSSQLLMLTDWELFFYWDIATPGTDLPVVTVWPRYDPALPENEGFQQGKF